MVGRCLVHQHWRPSDSFLPSKPDQQTTHGKAHVPGDGNIPASFNNGAHALHRRWNCGLVSRALRGCGAVYMFCRDSTLFPSRNLTADVLIAKVRCRCCVLCPTRVEDMPFRYRFYSHLSCLNGSRSQVHDIWRSSGPVRNNYFHWGTPGCGFNFPSVYYSTNFRSGQICRRKCTSVVYA